LTGGHVVGKLFAVRQPTKSTHPSIPPGVTSFGQLRVFVNYFNCSTILKIEQ